MLTRRRCVAAATFAWLVSPAAAFAPLHRQQQNAAATSSLRQMTNPGAFEQGLQFVLTTPTSGGGVEEANSMSASSSFLTSLADAFGAASQSVVATAQDEAVQAVSAVLLNSGGGDPVVGSSWSEQVVGAAAAFPSFSVAAATTGGSTFEIDPVVSKTLAELEQTLSHPPSLRVPVPDGKGLAQPLTESMERAVVNLQQYQQTSSNGATTDSFVKVNGFEVKSSVLEQLSRFEALGDAYRTQVAREVQENVVPMVAANNAAMARQLYANADALQHATADQWTALSVQLQQVSSNTDSSAWNEAWKVLSPPSEVLESWNLDELGGWYAGAFLGFLLLAVYQKDGAGTVAGGTGAARGLRRARSGRGRGPGRRR